MEVDRPVEMRRSSLTTFEFVTGLGLALATTVWAVKADLELLAILQWILLAVIARAWLRERSTPRDTS